MWNWISWVVWKYPIRKNYITALTAFFSRKLDKFFSRISKKFLFFWFGAKNNPAPKKSEPFHGERMNNSAYHRMKIVIIDHKHCMFEFETMRSSVRSSSLTSKNFKVWFVELELNRTYSYRRTRSLIRHTLTLVKEFWK